MNKRKSSGGKGGSGEHRAPVTGEFDLGRPQDPGFQQLAAQPETASVALSGKLADEKFADGKFADGEGGSAGRKGRRADEDKKFKPMTWKGFEEEEELDSLPFGKRSPREEAEMDMTPMVDVTFLLLIFFMVTASFKLQKAIQQQPDLSDDPSEIVTERLEQTEAIEIYIDENDNYTLRSNEAAEEEAAGKVEMWQKLARMKQDSPSVKRLLITANENCSHGAVINAWDAGADAKIFEIAIAVVQTQ